MNPRCFTPMFHGAVSCANGIRGGFDLRKEYLPRMQSSGGSLRYGRSSAVVTRRKAPAMNRFENHRFDNYEVNAESGCWEWRGYLDSNGYGRIYDPTRPKNRRSLWVHRFSYERFKGEIPEGYEIDHVCQNTACMNPEHLDAVTPAEHGRRTWERLGTHDQHKLAAHLRSTGMTYRDIGETMGLLGKSNAYQMVKAAIRKGHVSADEIPTARRLSEDERSDIRDLHALGVPQGELAAWYRMDNSQISRVCNNVDRKSGQAREAQKREATP